MTFEKIADLVFRFWGYRCRDPLCVLQLFERHSARKRMFRAAQYCTPAREQNLGVQTGRQPETWIGPDIEVYAPVLKAVLKGWIKALHDVKMDLRKSASKWSQGFGQEPQMCRDRKAEGYRTGCVAAELLEFILGPTHIVQDPDCPPDEGFSTLGRDHAFRPPLRERCPQLALKLRQAAGQRRLRR